MIAAAEARKNSGNDYFTKKEFEMAQVEYSAALEGLPRQDPRTIELEATLRTNRAAAYLGLNHYTAAIKDCDDALQLDPTREKAMFRRSQANEGLGKASDALKDLMELVRRNPKNKAAVAAARRCKEQVESKREVDHGPVAGALKAIREERDNHERVVAALKTVIALTHDDEGAANMSLRLGGCGLLWSLCKSPDSAEADLSVRALASMCCHASVADAVNSQMVLSEPESMLWEDLVALIESREGSLAQNAVVLALKLQSRGSRGTSGSGATELSEIETAVSVWAAAVSHRDAEVRSAGLDAAVQWCSETAPAMVAPPVAANHVPGADRRAGAEAERRWSDGLKKRAVALCKSPANAAMFALLDSDVFMERQKVLAAFGRVLGTVGDEEVIKSLLGPLVLSSPPSAVRDLSLMRRKTALTSALLLANGELGVWMLSLDGAVRECLALIASGDDMGQSMAAETLCLAASKESGRSLLGPVVEAGTLDALLDSPNARARSAAASTLAKLGVASRALASDSADTGRLLNTAMHLLKGAEDSQAEEGSTLTAEQQKFAEAATVTTERAVEVLAALITRSAVKDELSHGSGRCSQALTRLCSISKDGRGAAAYGLAHIFASLTVTNKEVQERLLAEKEMEITPEQLEELQRITKQKSEGEEEDMDNAERCGWRIRQIVQADGIRALVRLSEGASEATKEQIALALRQIAVEPSVRGSLVQQGGYKCCVNLAANAESSAKCVRDATWGLAKTLVSTNPSMLTASQRMGCIACLLRLCKDHKVSDLTHFEALMGLTNVASFSDETKARIAAEKGVRTLEYLQFSDHELVRRAATECMTNLMPHSCMIEHLRSEEKLKLWCAFAEDFQSDLPTARAAAGTLAMAAGLEDEELHAGLLQSRVFEVWMTLLKSGSPELAHRAAVGIGSISHSQEAVSKMVGMGMKAALAKLAKKKNPDWAQVAAAAASGIQDLTQSMANVAIAGAAEDPKKR